MAFHLNPSTCLSGNVSATKPNRLNPLQAVIVSAVILCLSLSLTPAQAASAGLPPGYFATMYFLTVLTTPDLQEPCPLLGNTYSFIADWRSYRDPTYKWTNYFQCLFKAAGKAVCASYDATWSLDSNDYVRLEVKSDIYSYHVVYSGTIAPPDCEIEGTMRRLDAPDYHGTFTAYESTPPD